MDKIKGWKELFKNHILERGLNYYEMGFVYDLQSTEDGFEAKVEGTEDYHVEIEIQDDRVYDMTCDCPYANDGHYCKHMAAVLYEIENDESPVLSSKDPFERLKESRKELEDVIANIPVEDMKAIILSQAWSDASLRNEIMMKYAPITPSSIVVLKKQVSEIAYRCSDRGGFVDYYHAMDYTSELSRLLHTNVTLLLEREQHMAAFDLVNCVFQEVGTRDIDDSDGGTTYVADNCYEYWQQILDVCNDDEKKELFQWFMSHRENYVLDYMTEYINDFLMEEFQDEELLREKMKALDKMIANVNEETEDWYFSHYGQSNNILERIRIMEKLNYSKEEIIQYRNQYRSFSAIRKLEISEYMEDKDYENAIRVLLESKKIDKEYAGLVSDYSRQLMDIYKLMDKKDDYKQELIRYVFDRAINDIEHIMELKAVSEESEWIQYREELLNDKLSYPLQLELLEKEGLYRRLLETMQESIAGTMYIYYLDKYEKVLRKHFPNEVRDIYISYVKNAMKHVSDRKRYRELVEYLKKIRRYPEGKQLAQAVATEWKIAYKRRSAMMDELAKGGF